MYLGHLVNTQAQDKRSTYDFEAYRRNFDWQDPADASCARHPPVKGILPGWPMPELLIVSPGSLHPSTANLSKARISGNFS